MTLALDTTVYVGCLSGLANKKASVPATTRAAAASMAIACRQDVFIFPLISLYEASQAAAKRRGIEVPFMGASSLLRLRNWLSARLRPALSSGLAA